MPSIVLNEKLFAPMDRAKVLKKYTEDFFLGFDLSPGIVADYEKADALFHSLSRENMPSITEVIALYRQIVIEVEAELRAFIWNAPRVFRMSLDGLSLDPELEANRLSIIKKINSLDASIHLEDFSIGDAAIRHWDVFVLIEKLEIDQRAIEERVLISV